MHWICMHAVHRESYGHSLLIEAPPLLAEAIWTKGKLREWVAWYMQTQKWIQDYFWGQSGAQWLRKKVLKFKQKDFERSCGILWALTVSIGLEIWGLMSHRLKNLKHKSLNWLRNLRFMVLISLIILVFMVSTVVLQSGMFNGSCWS